MHEVENPYEPPKRMNELVVVPSHGIALSYRMVFIAIVVRAVFRFFGALIPVFLLLIDFKGLGVNWSTAVPLIAVFGVGCVVSHFILNLRSTSVWLDMVTGWPLYLAGIILAIVIVVTEMHPKGF